MSEEHKEEKIDQSRLEFRKRDAIESIVAVRDELDEMIDILNRIKCERRGEAQLLNHIGPFIVNLVKNKNLVDEMYRAIKKLIQDVAPEDSVRKAKEIEDAGNNPWS